MKENMQELMLDLLCKKATYGLNEQEERQLADLQNAAGTGDLSTSFELAAASIGIANLDTSEEMPDELQARIVADAEKHFGGTSTVTTVARDDSARDSMFSWLGWAVAAAACVALALTLYFTPRQSNVVKITEPTPAPEQNLAPAQLRQRLIDTAPDLARASWGAGNVKELTPSGDIVWSDAQQSGYMRLTGLPVNDPNKETYQLWIFDETQDEKTPIDGGTFDVNSSGEVVIPVDAKLRAKNTKMYAITVEKPGGVVVSKRERIVALAKRET
jgi:anti-sigma-K factor RskA